MCAPLAQPCYAAVFSAHFCNHFLNPALWQLVLPPPLICTPEQGQAHTPSSRAPLNTSVHLVPGSEVPTWELLWPNRWENDFLRSQCHSQGSLQEVPSGPAFWYLGPMWSCCPFSMCYTKRLPSNRITPSQKSETCSLPEDHLAPLPVCPPLLTLTPGAPLLSAALQRGLHRQGFRKGSGQRSSKAGNLMPSSNKL